VLRDKNEPPFKVTIIGENRCQDSETDVLESWSSDSLQLHMAPIAQEESSLATNPVISFSVHCMQPVLQINHHLRT
jgi:hypothetical protein